MFRHKATTEELESELDRVKVEDEVLTHKKDIEEKTAVIAQLKKQYGHNWMQTLGVSKLTDLASLRSFLKSANQGMRGVAGRNSMRSTTPDSSDKLKTGAGDTAIGKLSTSFGNKTIKA